MPEQIADMRAVMSATSKKAKAMSDLDIRAAPSWMQDVVDVADEIIGGGEGELAAVDDFGDVEYKVGHDPTFGAIELRHILNSLLKEQVDTLHNTAHRALQYTVSTSRFLDGIFASLASDLQGRPAVDSEHDDGHLANFAGLSPQPEPKIDPIYLLRALAAADTADGETIHGPTRLPSTATTPNSKTPKRAGITPGR